MPLRPLNLGLRMAATAAGPSYDADALTAFAAVEATGVTLSTAQKTAANTFIVGLKADNLWATFYALYLFIGGTSAAHAVNWKQPGTYNATWVNSPTHDANGVTGNGSTSYGYTTGLSGTQTGNLLGLSVYNRTTASSSSGVQKRLIGNGTAGSSVVHFIEYVDNTGLEQNRGVLGSSGNIATDSNATQKTGLLSVNRTANANFKGYHNGTQYLTNTTTDTNAPHTVPFALLAVNVNGTYMSHAAENIAMAAVHSAHTAANASAFSTHVQNLQTALGRNV